MTTWVMSELARLDKAIQPQAGQVATTMTACQTANNTVRDLLGVTVPPSGEHPGGRFRLRLRQYRRCPSRSRRCCGVRRVALRAICGPRRVPQPPG